MSRPSDETYLGDGVYASFGGFQVQLRAPCDGGDHVVYLDSSTYRALRDFLSSTRDYYAGVDAGSAATFAQMYPT